MKTTAITKEDLAGSVLAVPPLARRPDGAVCPVENAKIIRHIEGGGISTLLYGGNANFYHIRPSEYRSTLEMLVETVAPDTWVIPSAGPCHGTALDQAEILKGFDFPTSMMLPMSGLTTGEGVARGFRQYVEAVGRPAVLYLKADGYLEPEAVAELVNDGFVSFIKYARVEADPAVDAYLEKLVTLVSPDLIVSGIGEQPAITHLRKFGLTGFTAGCVCVAPRLSETFRKYVQAGKIKEAETLRKLFRPLEDLRNEINPIRVLHDAVALVGIAETGPAFPLLSNLSVEERERVEVAAKELLNREVACQ